MAIKKSQLYSSLWASCDALRGGMDASQYKDYVLVLLFIKYISDKYAGKPFAPITIPEGATFDDMVALKGSTDIGDSINKNIIAPIQEANQLNDMPDFNDDAKLGSGKEMVDRLTDLIAIFEDKALDFSSNNADGDDILGDAYEYLMRHFATESGKSKGQFYTPSEVSRILAKVIGIGEADTTSSTTAYDPTCGSGSLLLKVGDEATVKPTLYGQEKDSATSALAKMNMILHDYPTAEIKRGNTLANPMFKGDDGLLEQYDYVVANPPFSDKKWTTGVSTENDPFDRFKHFGTPPDKQGDYAYLLHILRSMKSTAKGACILPHGVLFRGNAEASIRENLIKRGYIKGIIGLPANLFYGTGIPACVLILDKENAQNRKGIFMLDASSGFMKDGNKNRLRERDVHKIVDSFQNAQEISGYSRMVGFEEIEKNEYNLNLPRYIDSSEAEDVQDLSAHLQGGIPTRDLDALEDYWSISDSLRESLFTELRTGYHSLKIPQSDLKETIQNDLGVCSFLTAMKSTFVEWKEVKTNELKKLEQSCNPKHLISDLSQHLLGHYEGMRLTDHYAVYQHLMDYWAETMQDDVYLISADGWKAETYRILVKDKKGKEKNKGWACDLVPVELIIDRYLPEKLLGITELESDLELVISELSELEEEHSGDEGVLRLVTKEADAKALITSSNQAIWRKLDKQSAELYAANLDTVSEKRIAMKELMETTFFLSLGINGKKPTLAVLKKYVATSEPNDNTISIQSYLDSDACVKKLNKENKELLAKTIGAVEEFIKENPDDSDVEDFTIANSYLSKKQNISNHNKRIKEAKKELDQLAYKKYSELTEEEIKVLVVEDKWLATLETQIVSESDKVSQTLIQRLKELAERYDAPLSELTDTASELEAKIAQHLAEMGLTW